MTGLLRTVTQFNLKNVKNSNQLVFNEGRRWLFPKIVFVTRLSFSFNHEIKSCYNWTNIWTSAKFLYHLLYKLLKRAFSAFCSFLQNENRTIFGRDIANTRKKTKYWVWVEGGGAFIGCFTVYGLQCILTVNGLFNFFPKMLSWPDYLFLSITKSNHVIIKYISVKFCSYMAHWPAVTICTLICTNYIAGISDTLCLFYCFLCVLYTLAYDCVVQWSW